MVWRDGRQRELDVSTLVPGDVGALRVGDVVPADLRIGEADQLECAEAVLTGESASSSPSTDRSAGAADYVGRLVLLPG